MLVVAGGSHDAPLLQCDVRQFWHIQCIVDCGESEQDDETEHRRATKRRRKRVSSFHAISFFNEFGAACTPANLTRHYVAGEAGNTADVSPAKRSAIKQVGDHRGARRELTCLQVEFDLKTINPLITCDLCKGYLISATTISECLHTCTTGLLVDYQHLPEYCR